MNRWPMLIITLIVVIGRSASIVTEAMLASVFLLNALGGSSQMQLILATIMGQAAAMAINSGDTPSPEAIDSVSDVVGTASPIIHTLGTNPKRSVDRYEQQYPAYNDYPEVNYGQLGNIVVYKNEGDSSSEHFKQEFIEDFEQIALKVAEQLSDYLGLNHTVVSGIIQEGADSPYVPVVLESVRKRMSMSETYAGMLEYAAAIRQIIADLPERDKTSEESHN